MTDVHGNDDSGISSVLVSAPENGDEPLPRTPENRLGRWAQWHGAVYLTIRKICEAIIVLFVVTIGTSALTDLIPGSPTALILGQFATKEQVATLNHQLGLDQPFWVRYYHWLVAALHGNLGTSIQTNETIDHMLVTHIPVTLEIALVSLVLSLGLAIPIAMVSAAYWNGALDRAIRGASSGLLAVPPFVSCVVLTLLLTTKLGWLPSFGWVPLTQNVGLNLEHAALAIIVLVLAITPLFVRVLRADLLATLREDYVLAARARGMPEAYVMTRHALRPASISLFTLTGLVFGFLVGGSIILENYFSLPGIGQMVGQAVQGKDLTVVQGVVVLMALFYVLINALIDIGYRIIDPQARAV